MITTNNLLKSYISNKQYIRTTSKITKKYILLLQRKVLQSWYIM